MGDEHKIENSLMKLIKYIENNNFSGYDPYDILNSPNLSKIHNKIIKLIFTQINVYSTINLRPFLKVQTGINPKALGLFLTSYSILYKKNLINKEEFELISRKIIQLLNQNKSEGYSGYCWGFNFPWQDLKRYSKNGLPTIVITSYIAQSLLDVYKIKKDDNILKIARSSCDFILKDLNLTETKKGICFSYTPIDNYCVHNANALGAALFARMYSITKEQKLKDCCMQAFNFLLAHQEENGSWSYSLDPYSNKKRYQIDFHQGFILDALCDFLQYINPDDKRVMTAINRGANFYLTKQFDSYGRSKWRYPIKWPIDIHNQAQGIITAINIQKLLNDKYYRRKAELIAEWTIEHMQSSQGYFYYQKWPLITNKIAYMRWGQAWMMLALAKIKSSNK